MGDREFDRRLAALVRQRREEVPARLAAELRRKLLALERPEPRRRTVWLQPLRLAAAAVVLFGLGVATSLLWRDAAPAVSPLLRPPAPARLSDSALPVPAAPASAVQTVSDPARSASRPAPALSATPGEIRTEFEIAGTDIRIIWVQKENFDLRRI